jgi:hypothetical protein
MRPSVYENMILRATGCRPDEAPLVEAYMRAEHATLDSLRAADFRRVAKESYAAVRMAPEVARELAMSYGLIPR